MLILREQNHRPTKYTEFWTPLTQEVAGKRWALRDHSML